jgi:hypothetical protein
MPQFALEQDCTDYTLQQYVLLRVAAENRNESVDKQLLKINQKGLKFFGLRGRYLDHSPLCFDDAVKELVQYGYVTQNFGRMHITDAGRARIQEIERRFLVPYVAY